MGAAESTPAPPPPPLPPPSGHQGVWPPREASTSLPSSHDQQLALLAVLEGLAHDAHVREALEGFVTKHCELFPPDSEAEIPLVCTEIHTSYQKLFERSLERILTTANLTTDVFAALMQTAVDAGLGQADAILDFAAAADDFVAFIAMMRTRRRQLNQADASSWCSDTIAAKDSEELRAHLWGITRRLGREAEGAARAEVRTSLDGYSSFIPSGERAAGVESCQSTVLLSGAEEETEEEAVLLGTMQAMSEAEAGVRDGEAAQSGTALSVNSEAAREQQRWVDELAAQARAQAEARAAEAQTEAETALARQLDAALGDGLGNETLAEGEPGVPVSAGGADGVSVPELVEARALSATEKEERRLVAEQVRSALAAVASTRGKPEHGARPARRAGPPRTAEPAPLLGELPPLRGQQPPPNVNSGDADAAKPVAGRQSPSPPPEQRRAGPAFPGGVSAPNCATTMHAGAPPPRASPPPLGGSHRGGVQAATAAHIAARRALGDEVARRDAAEENWLALAEEALHADEPTRAETTLSAQSAEQCVQEAPVSGDGDIPVSGGGEMDAAEGKPLVQYPGGGPAARGAAAPPPWRDGAAAARDNQMPPPSPDAALEQRATGDAAAAVAAKEAAASERAGLDGIAARPWLEGVARRTDAGEAAARAVDSGLADGDDGGGLNADSFKCSWDEGEVARRKARARLQLQREVAEEEEAAAVAAFAAESEAALAAHAAVAALGQSCATTLPLGVTAKSSALGASVASTGSEEALMDGLLASLRRA